MTTQNDAQPAVADLSAEEPIKQALGAMAALGLIQAPQRVSEDYTRGHRRQLIDGNLVSTNDDPEFWQREVTRDLERFVSTAQHLANSIALRDYLLAGSTIEELREQLASVKRTIDASVPGDEDDRIYGSLWVSAVDLQQRIELLEEA